MSHRSDDPDKDPRLTQAIALIEQPDQQGIPLRSSDYVWLVAITVLVPAALIVVGALT